MPEITDHPVFSQKDILEAYRNYDASEETREPVLYFLSELMGLSIDALLCALDRS